MTTSNYIYAIVKEHADKELFPNSTCFIMANEAYFKAEGCIECEHIKSRDDLKGVQWPPEFDEIEEATIIAMDKDEAWTRATLNALGFRESEDLTKMMAGE